MDNAYIIVGLISIGMALFIGYAWGNRKGIQEGRNEMIRRFTKHTVRQLKRMEFGGAFGRN